MCKAQIDIIKEKVNDPGLDSRQTEPDNVIVDQSQIHEVMRSPEKIWKLLLKVKSNHHGWTLMRK